MAKQTINNGESGNTVRSKLNSNFSELYARGYVRCDEVSVTAGANTITLSSSVDNTDYIVLINDPDGVGIGKAYDKSTSSFKVDALGNGTLIYELKEKV